MSSDTDRLNSLVEKVLKLEHSSLSMMSALIQLNSITSTIRFKTSLAATPELKAEFAEMSRRVDAALADLKEAVDAPIK